MTKKRFIKLITAVWHKLPRYFKDDCSLNEFIERHLRRAVTRGYDLEFRITTSKFLCYSDMRNIGVKTKG